MCEWVLGPLQKSHVTRAGLRDSLCCSGWQLAKWIDILRAVRHERAQHTKEFNKFAVTIKEKLNIEKKWYWWKQGFLFIWARFPFTLHPDLHKRAGGPRTHTAVGQRWDWKLILAEDGVSLNSFFGSFPWVVPELNTLASVASVPTQPPTLNNNKKRHDGIVAA